MGFITPELEKIFVAHISKPVTIYRAPSGSYHAKTCFSLAQSFQVHTNPSVKRGEDVVITFFIPMTKYLTRSN